MGKAFLPESCDWCPRACGANRRAGQAGACGADDSLVVARAALHYWEEPPVSGERGSGTVFFSNCPLRCVYCQNAVIARGEAGQVVTVARLAEILGELEARGALNANLVTPTHYRDHAIEAVRRARAAGLKLPVVWNTSGYETVASIRALAGTVDVYLTDFKYADGELARAYSSAPDYPQIALAALEEMVREVGPCAYDEVDGQPRMVRGIVVRHLMLPGRLDDSKAVVRMVHERFGEDVRLSLMNQYTPMIDASSAAAARFPELLGRVSDNEYERLLDFADDLGIADYFWQQGGAAEESFIPAFDGEGVQACDAEGGARASASMDA